MYDKYFTAIQFSLNTTLPKHKGVLFSGGTAGTPGSVSARVFNNSGGSASASFLINSSPYILPIQLVTVTSLPGGLTAWYLN
jgi:hypothetical protein